MYGSGRGNNWVKKTCAQRETLAIAGVALDEGKWDGIYIGRRKGEDLVHAGKIDNGFDKVSTSDLLKRLKPPVMRNTEAETEMTLMRWSVPPPPRTCACSA